MPNQHYVLPDWAQMQNAVGYSQAVRSGDVLYISGTVSMDAEMTPLHVGDMAGQLTEIYRRIGETLAAHGLTFANVVRETTFTTDLAAMVEAIGARRPFYGDGPFPAATGVEVSKLLHPDLLLEVEVTASFAK